MLGYVYCTTTTNTEVLRNPSPILITAGYLGGAFFGGLFVVLSGNRVCATCAASGFVLALLISLRFSPNSTLTFMSLGFSVVTIAFILIDWFVYTPFIQFVTLYYGVFIGAFR
jgi:Peptidase M50B-like